MADDEGEGRGASFLGPSKGYGSGGRRLSRVGDYVDALWPDDGLYYRARVAAVTDGKLPLEYEDGAFRDAADAHPRRRDVARRVTRDVYVVSDVNARAGLDEGPTRHRLGRHLQLLACD